MHSLSFLILVGVVSFCVAGCNGFKSVDATAASDHQSSSSIDTPAGSPGSSSGTTPAPSPNPSPVTSSFWNASTYTSGKVRGFNSVGDYSAQSLSDLAATGANVVRIFLDLNRTPNTKVYTISSSNLAYADTVINAGAKLGFKVILVFEPLPNQTAEEFWDDVDLQNSIASNWQTVATRYKGRAEVAGYDLINEPITKVPWNQGGQEQWQALATKWIQGIRKVDPDHTIFFEPAPGGLPMGFQNLKPLAFSNIVYSVHFYQPHEITHQGLYSYQQSLAYPNASSSSIGTADKTGLSNTLQPVRQFVAQYNLPIYVGEFSCVRWAPNSSSYRYVQDAIALFEAEHYAWTYHSWREYQGWDAEIPESYFDAFTFVGAKPQGFENANTALVRRSDTDTMSLLKQQFLKNSK